MIPIPSPLVEFILLGPMDDRRQLQDSPILGDVWVAFGGAPSERQDLLIAPYKGQHAGNVAASVNRALSQEGKGVDANIAYLQGLVVAHLTFDEVLRVVVPRTKWWQDKKRKELGKYVAEKTRVESTLADILNSARAWHTKTGTRTSKELSSLDRFVALTGFILWAGEGPKPKSERRTTRRKVPKPKNEKLTAKPEDQIAYVLDNADVTKMSELLGRVVKKMSEVTAEEGEALIWQVSLNRRAMPALTKSVPAVKADAAKTLFNVNCSEIFWAVVDSGIDGNHPAFRTADGKKSRVERSFDFKNFRRIVSLSNLDDEVRKGNVEELLKGSGQLLKPPKKPKADKHLKQLAQDALNRGPIHWDLVEKFVEIKPDTDPPTNHGTHVAGIIGANREGVKNSVDDPEVVKDNEDIADGMCPDIKLYDFRVLGRDAADTEFAIIAALQFIRYLNDRDNFVAVHGANLSLSIPHDVRNFACGRTPICDECERLVESGVVVVAAAGNHGYKSFETREGAYESYAAFSITDPGNADSVITVGATHRFWPHTYGVSFFSSRGPTGDGRLKPDLVAPGERIRAPLRGGHDAGGEWGDLDGTSMAAPHVSGAAAMLMARYSELIGQPRRIKRILCESATDLGRERSFQGHGMLDVLRAFQSI